MLKRFFPAPAGSSFLIRKVPSPWSPPPPPLTETPPSHPPLGHPAKRTFANVVIIAHGRITPGKNHPWSIVFLAAPKAGELPGTPKLKGSVHPRDLQRPRTPKTAGITIFSRRNIRNSPSADQNSKTWIDHPGQPRIFGRLRSNESFGEWPNGCFGAVLGRRRRRARWAGQPASRARKKPCRRGLANRDCRPSTKGSETAPDRTTRLKHFDRGALELLARSRWRKETNFGRTSGFVLFTAPTKKPRFIADDRSTTVAENGEQTWLPLLGPSLVPISICPGPDEIDPELPDFPKYGNERWTGNAEVRSAGYRESGRINGGHRIKPPVKRLTWPNLHHCPAGRNDQNAKKSKRVGNLVKILFNNTSGGSVRRNSAFRGPADHHPAIEGKTRGRRNR